MLAHWLAGLYRSLRIDVLGRAAVRRCCAAYSAGAGIDEWATEVLLGMGPSGIRLLEHEAAEVRRRKYCEIFTNNPAKVLNCLTSIWPLLSIARTGSF